jgi:hypothetical protein
MTGRAPETTQADIDLYFAIVRETIRLFKHRWPAARLHLISWDIHDFFAKDKATFHAGLASMGVELHFIDQMLPGYSSDLLKYSLHPAELHPNPFAYQMVASYVAEHVLASKYP